MTVLYGLGRSQETPQSRMVDCTAGADLGNYCVTSDLNEPKVLFSSASFLFFLVFCFLGLHMWHKEVPKLGTELEL